MDGHQRLASNIALQGCLSAHECRSRFNSDCRQETSFGVWTGYELQGSFLLLIHGFRSTASNIPERANIPERSNTQIKATPWKSRLTRQICVRGVAAYLQGFTKHLLPASVFPVPSRGSQEPSARLMMIAPRCPGTSFRLLEDSSTLRSTVLLVVGLDEALPRHRLFLPASSFAQETTTSAVPRHSQTCEHISPDAAYNPIGNPANLCPSCSPPTFPPPPPVTILMTLVIWSVIQSEGVHPDALSGCPRAKWL